MPVLSPHRSSSGSLSGSYRPSYGSVIERPIYSSSYSSPRVKSYSERYTSRSYTDVDGRRVFSRSGSITEDGITTRFREEHRESSAPRDSYTRDYVRDGSIDYPRRDSSLSRDRLSSINVIDSVAELRNKYSPANYVPAILRKNDNISRSKSINDIGLPPLDAKPPKKKEDDNGNRASVADLRRKFTDKNERKSASPPVEVVPTTKISENRFKKQDDLKAPAKRVVKKVNGVKKEEKEVRNGEAKIDEEEEEVKAASRVNNFASYIPSKDYQKVEENGVDVTTDETLENGSKNDLSSQSSSSKLSAARSTASPPSGAPSALSSTTSRRSLERATAGRRPIVDCASDDDDDAPERGYSTAASTMRQSPQRTLGLNGLKNIGNTCFMNSVIQCLSNTRQLSEYVRRDDYVKDINTSISSMKGALIRAFSHVIKELWSEDGSDRVVNTVALKNQIQRFAPRFMGYAQQDAQEFLRYLLEGLHEDVNRVIEKPKPILTEIDEKLSDAEKSSEAWNRYLRMDNSRILDLFVGQLKSTLKCTHCGHCSVTFDPFWDLSLPIPTRTGQLRLSQCLDSFTREETLDGDEKPTCSKCKERRKCTKSFTIQKFPKILVIHLKRFSPTERFRGKLSVTVDFPLEGLDMSNYAADSSSGSACRYNLYAVSNHSGTTYSGHYTAYCRHPYNHSWYEYNDSRVSSTSPRSIVSGEAYVLFYEQEGQKSHL
ncbi:ubiquitin carboxyl-terminal hydrolase 2 isoform X2 [Aethina tumida]|uniref:ubiquitin carboxyl-terminal hydrolase 2 isoform X2 n=1 Tax=Aethina tumida TaxID=116153 RepID=UPI0021481356|nr:ubiquitin carboxyl-terminal hydrolase 2 isoform X2 [Aethina tumida]